MLESAGQYDPRFLSRARTFSRVVAGLVMLVGIITLAGWFFDIFRLKALYAGITMKSNTAVSFVLAGFSLLVLNYKGCPKFFRFLAQFAAIAVAVIGLMTASEHLVGWDLRIDQLLFIEPPGALDTTSPNRMGPPASTCFSLAGAALWLLHRDKAIRAAQILSILIGLWAMLAATGYAYDAHALYNIARFTGIALVTAITLFLFSIGLLAARVDRGLVAFLSYNTSGAIIARRLLFMILTVPFLLGWLEVVAAQAGYYDLGFGTAALVLLLIVIFTAVTWRTAARLSQVEQQRITAELTVREKDEGLRRQLSFNKAVMTNMGEGLYTVDDKGDLTFMNPSAEKLFGWSLEELRGRKMHDATHHKRRDGSPFPIEECSAIQVLKNGQTLINLEDVFVRKDGSFFDVMYSSSPIVEDGRISGLVVVFRDITERKRAEETLRENERRQRMLAQIGESAGELEDVETVLKAIAERVAKELNASRCGYSQVNLDAGQLIVEADYHGELGSLAGSFPISDYAHHLREQCLQGRISVVEDLAEHPETRAQYESIFKPINIRSHINVPLMRNGRWSANFWVTHHLPRQWQPAEIELMEVIADRVWLLVERKRAEEEREQLLAREQAAREQAETANRLKDEFLTTVSHELRTPLSAILGWSTMLRTGKLDENDSERAMESIERNARAQAQLVEDILDVSRTISGKLRLDIQPIELVPVIHAAIDSVRPAAEAKQIDLDIDLDERANRIKADAVRMQQVVWNLLANAVKFSRPNGRVRIELKRVGDKAQINVTDNGEGISAAFLPKVFNRFQQADGSTTRRHGGLGLGLAIARHLVEMHGGTIEAASDGPGKGATFTVNVPIASGMTGALPSLSILGQDFRPHPSGDESRELTDTRVLVVDDEEDTREMLQTVLEAAGAEVLTAPSAGEGLKALTRWRPHLLICDLGMPGEDGYGFIRRVRSLRSDAGGNVPAIALTGFVRIEERMRALEAGYQMFVPKPVEADELTMIVSTLIQNRVSN